MKAEVTLSSGGAFKNHKSHSAEEILAAGGATAFGRKSGKDNITLIRALSNVPEVESFTEKEWNDTLKQLRG